MMQTIALPKHYGVGGMPWPQGAYWLIELRRSGRGAPLFWMDDYDGAGRTGWTFVPSFAAGFASKEDAESAFDQRCAVPVDGGRIEAVEHVWED